MHALIDCILGWDEHIGKGHSMRLGYVKAFYSCVEAQGCGSLHCHMLIWIIGVMNQNEIHHHVFRKTNEQFMCYLL